MSKLKNGLLKIAPQRHMLLDCLLMCWTWLVGWLLHFAARCCRLFQFQKSTVIMGELQKVCVEKFIFCQALVQSSQDLYKFGPVNKELKNI